MRLAWITAYTLQSKYYEFREVVFDLASSIIVQSDQTIWVEFDVSESTRDVGMRLSFFFGWKGALFKILWWGMKGLEEENDSVIVIYYLWTQLT